MHCHACGEQIEAESAFCRHCGVKQHASTIVPEKDAVAGDSTVPPSATDPDRFVLKIIGGFVAVLVLIAVVSNLSGTPTGQAIAANEAAPDVSEVELAARDAASAASAAAAAANSALSGSGQAVQGTSKWSYSSDEAKVRGTKSFYASTTSTNAINQAPPYGGGTTMELTIRQSSNKGTDVMLIISEGQMMCPSYEGCSATVRFDDGHAESIRLNGPSDNSSETVFVTGAKRFVASLKKAKHLVVEKTLYQAGNPQFEFDVSGLNWDH